MTPDTQQAAQVKASIDGLIQAVSNREFDVLDRIYHDDMKIFMVSADGQVNQSDKAGFISHVVEKTEAADAPQTWAKYHLVEADERNGHVVISRKVNLSGEMKVVTLSIDLVHQDDRWQITREVIAL